MEVETVLLASMTLSLRNINNAALIGGSPTKLAFAGKVWGTPFSAICDRAINRRMFSLNQGHWHRRRLPGYWVAPWRLTGTTVVVDYRFGQSQWIVGRQ